MGKTAYKKRTSKYMEQKGRSRRISTSGRNRRKICIWKTKRQRLRILNICTELWTHCTNTLHPHRESRTATWPSPNGLVHNQIDFILPHDISHAVSIRREKIFSDDYQIPTDIRTLHDVDTNAGNIKYGNILQLKRYKRGSKHNLHSGMIFKISVTRQKGLEKCNS